MEVLDLIKPLIDLYSGHSGLIVQIISIIGSARLFVKPIMSLAMAYVQVTPTLNDDASLARFMESKFYKTFSYVVDWSLSIKLPAAK